MVGVDPRLVDPQHGDFRVEPESPAAGYGCQTFLTGPREATPAVLSAEPLVPALTINARPGSHLSASVPASGEDGNSTPAARPVRASIIVSGPLTQDTTWDADTVRVVGDVLVPDGLTLSILPGALVRFEGFFGLRVLGRLLAVGAPQARILFTSAHPELFEPDTTRAGSWNGIVFPATAAANGTSLLEWCDLSCSKAVGQRLEGGVLYLDGFSGLLVRNCRFTSNLAGYGGVLFAQRGSAPVLAGCVMTENYSLLRGSSVYCADGYPRLNACTIVWNHSLNPESFDDTGVVHAHISKPQLNGCIVRDNDTAFFLGWELREAKPWYVRWCDIDAGGFPGEGDFDADPLFVGGGEHPLALGAGSPCIDAGPPDGSGLALLPLDLAGLPRLSGGRLDSGAYEWPATDAAGGDVSGRAPMGLLAYPNPFVGATTLRFYLLRASRVRLTACDATGRRLGPPLEGVRPAGMQELTWGPGPFGGGSGTGGGLLGGVVFVRLEVDGMPRAAVKLLSRR